MSCRHLCFFFIHLLGNLALSDQKIAVKNVKPKWHSGTPTAEIAKICSEEKDPKQKALVCLGAVSRYSHTEAKQIPAEAKAQAQELLKLHESDPKDPLYQFAFHDSHQTLGRLYLLEGNKTAAKEELRKSLEGPLTVPLKQRGPKMTLASELLLQGEKQAVIDYLTAAEKVSENAEVTAQMQKWKAEILGGKRPDLKKNKLAPYRVDN